MEKVSALKKMKVLIPKGQTQQKMILRKTSINFSITLLFGKTMENIRIRVRLEFNKKDENDKINKQQSKITLNRIHKSYENYVSYAFKQNEVLMDKPIYSGFAILEFCKLHMYETYYDKVQLCF